MAELEGGGGPAAGMGAEEEEADEAEVAGVDAEEEDADEAAEEIGAAGASPGRLGGGNE